MPHMKLVHWPLMGGLLHLVQRGEDWARLANVPITVLLYNGPLLCSFHMPITRLKLFDDKNKDIDTGQLSRCVIRSEYAYRRAFSLRSQASSQ